MSRCGSCKHMMCPGPGDICVEWCDMYFADGPKYCECDMYQAGKQTRCKCVEQEFDESNNCIYYEVC